MEVAGLALAIYPVTVLAFEQYKKGAKYISNWAQYRRRYEAFIRDMEGQQLFFEVIIQDLLCGGPDPFLTGNSGQSKDAFLQITTDASFTGWKSPVLKQRLKIRLDSRYDWCMYTIKRIYEIMIELGELLDIQALDSSEKTPDWWRFQWRRIIQTLFAEAGYEDHKEAKRLIEELKQMIELSDKQRLQGGLQRNSTLAPFFQARRDNANNLYGALRSGWNCYCNAAHNVMLQLERKLDRGEDEFNMLCVVPSNAAEDKTKEIHQLSLGRELHVKAWKKEISAIVEPLRAAQKNTQHSQKPLPTSSPTLKSLSVNSKSQPNQSTNKQKRDSLRVHVADIGLSLRERLRGKSSGKIKQVKRFEVIQSLQTQRIDEENPREKPKVTIVFDDSVSTAEATSTGEAAQFPPTTDPISDLCNKLRTDSVDASLGYLLQGDYNYEILSQSLPRPDTSTTTLHELLEANVAQPLKFPAEKRALVAAILASSLLQLQKTHWISDIWSKRDIFFTTHDKKIEFSQPYVSQEFLSSKSSDTLTINTNETTSAPQRMSSSFSPSFRLRTSLESLGILLIELCFGVPIERWHDKVRLKPLDVNAYNHEYNLAIANAWTWEEIRAHDPMFSDPINSCLHFPFRRDKDEIVDDMYELIAKPLFEETRKKWPPLNSAGTY